MERVILGTLVGLIAGLFINFILSNIFLDVWAPVAILLFAGGGALGGWAGSILREQSLPTAKNRLNILIDYAIKITGLFILLFLFFIVTVNVSFPPYTMYLLYFTHVLPLVSSLLSIVGLIQIHKTGETGTMPATIILILSCAFYVVYVAPLISVYL